MHRFAADRPPRPSKREIAAAAAPTVIERSRDISDEAIFTGTTPLVGTTNQTDSYINVKDGLLYYYDPTLSNMYINDNGKQYSFTIDAGNKSIKLRVVKYYGQYYFYYISGSTQTTLKRYDPSGTGAVIDTSLNVYSSDTDLGYDSRLEIVNGLLLFGTIQRYYNMSGQLHCIQSDHTVLISHTGNSMQSWSIFLQHGQNLLVCDMYGNKKIVYKPISAIGISGGWTSITLPPSYEYMTNLQLINGEIYGVDTDYASYVIIYKLSSDYSSWTKIGQTIVRADYLDDNTYYGQLKYIGGSLYLFPFYRQDLFFKLVGTSWVTVSHPTDSNLYLTHDIQTNMDGTFKQRGTDMYIGSFVRDKTTSLDYAVIIKIMADGTLSVIPPSTPTTWALDSDFIDGALYIGSDANLLQVDGSGIAVKKDTTLSGLGFGYILYIYYYGGQVYVQYANGKILRANLVTPGAVAAALSKDTQPIVFKNILMNGVSGEKIIPLTNVDARGIVNAADITTSGGNLADYASVKILALSAASAAGPQYPRFDVTSSDITSALLYVPFDSGGVVIRLGGVDYTLLFDSTVSPPTLSVNNNTVQFGSNFSLGGTELRFLSRGSIILSNATDKNSFPLHLCRGLYTCYDRTIVYTKETVYNLRDGKTLPNAQGRYKAVAGNILQDLGETVNIVTPVPAWSRVRVSPRLRYVFRLVQLVSGGAATGGVSGSPADDYVSGFVCTWAESGRPPINL